MAERSTEHCYMAEYQDGTNARGDSEAGGTWFVAGDIYGYPTIHDARDALDEPLNKGERVTATRVWRITTIQELV